MTTPLSTPPSTMPPSRACQCAFGLFALGLVCFLVLPGSTLFALGISYDAPGGAPAAKLHPGSTLMVMAWFVALCSRGNPLGAALAQLRAQRLLALYLAAMLALFGYALLRYGMGGAAFLIDTHLMAAVAVLVLQQFGPRRQRQTLLLMAGVLVLNAALGIGEAALQTRLLPWYIGGQAEVPEDFFRASALMGHPLQNAQQTATLLPVLLLLPLAAGIRCALVLWLGLALLAFGGRVSLLLALLLYGAVFVAQAFKLLFEGRLNYRQVTGGAIGVLLAAAAMVAVVVSTGLGERIFASLSWDNSASVRVRVWEVFSYMSDVQLIFGATADEIDVLYQQLGLDARFEAIENFWLLAWVQYGLVGFSLFAFGLGCALCFLWRQSFGVFRVALVLTVLVSSTTNSLVAKTPAWLLFMVAVQAAAHLRPRPPMHSPRAPLPFALQRGLLT